MNKLEKLNLTALMTFCTFSLIFAGQAHLSVSNLLDVYILASSLRMPQVQKMCKETMDQMKIPSDNVQVPQLVVSCPKFADKSFTTEIPIDDPTLCTSKNGLDASTQTDRSTSESGERGQEEWVMLKKTKQKTVSPSKSKLKPMPSKDAHDDSLPGGSLAIMEKSAETISVVCDEKDYVDETEDLIPCTDIKTVSEVNDNVKHHTSPLSRKKLESKTASVSHRISSEITPTNNSKLSAHTYSTRWARGTKKHCVSYASMTVGAERRESEIEGERGKNRKLFTCKLPLVSYRERESERWGVRGKYTYLYKYLTGNIYKEEDLRS